MEKMAPKYIYIVKITFLPEILNVFLPLVEKGFAQTTMGIEPTIF